MGTCPKAPRLSYQVSNFSEKDPPISPFCLKTACNNNNKIIISSSSSEIEPPETEEIAWGEETQPPQYEIKDYKNNILYRFCSGKEVKNSNNSNDDDTSSTNVNTNNLNNNNNNNHDTTKGLADPSPLAAVSGIVPK